MPFIVEKLQDDTRLLRVVREITKLTESQPSKLPTIGSIFQNTWVPFEVFVFLVRDHGFPKNANKDKRDFVEIKARSLLDAENGDRQGVVDVTNTSAEKKGCSNIPTFVRNCLDTISEADKENIIILPQKNHVSHHAKADLIKLCWEYCVVHELNQQHGR